jgi:hypothetical protein
MRRLRATTAVLASVAALLAITSLVATPAALASTGTVSPRVHCGGFNGHWSLNSRFPAIDIEVWGVLWSTCPGSDTVLELAPPHQSPNPIWHTRGEHSVGVNYVSGGFFDTGGIPSLKVCNNYGGAWHCSRPTHYWPVGVTDRGPGPPRGSRTDRSVYAQT